MNIDPLNFQSDHENYDICIVGSGAAGLAIANEFEGSNIRVLLVEGGGWNITDKNQALFETESTGDPFQSAQSGRFRVFGGSTVKWGGQSLPLREIDFEIRDWVQNSGWELPFDEVKKYYARANRFMFVDTLDYKNDVAKLLKYSIPSVDPEKLYFHFSKWSLCPNLRKHYGPRFKGSKNIDILLNANLVGLQLSEKCDHVKAADLKLSTGSTLRIRAKTFILATGGIETARLLLYFNKLNPDFLRKTVGSVGKYFQEHPAIRLGIVKPNSQKQLQRLFSGQRYFRRRYSVRLSLSENIQREQKLLNASAGFVFSLSENSDLDTVRKLLKGERLIETKIGILGAFVRSLSRLITLLKHRCVNGFIFLPDAKCEIAASIEQEPTRDSSISLTDKLDLLGIPIAKVHWKITNATRDTARALISEISLELKRLEIGTVVPEPWINSTDESNEMPKFSDQNHHMGSVRIGVDWKSSVVNTDLKLHEIDNMYVASSAVFPTSGHSNPTLTIIALSIRLALHLKTLFNQSVGETK